MLKEFQVRKHKEMQDVSCSKTWLFSGVLNWCKIEGIIQEGLKEKLSHILLYIVAKCLYQC
jgi:hypothetical protein